MYNCRHCGFVSHNENINYCNNAKCRYYGYCDKSCIKETAPCYKEKDCRNYNCNPCRDHLNFTRCSETKRDCAQKPSCQKHMPNPMPLGYIEKPNLGNTNTGINMYKRQESSEPISRFPDSSNALGFATVPFQTFSNPYPLDESLREGTIFPDLNMPYNKKIIRRG